MQLTWGAPIEYIFLVTRGQCAAGMQTFLQGWEIYTTYHIQRNINSKFGKMRQQRNMFQIKEQDETPQELSEVKIVIHLDFKVMIIKMIKKLGRRMDKL